MTPAWPESLTPYRELLRWRRRFWCSAALNVVLAAFVCYHEVTGNTLLRIFFFFLFSPLRVFSS